MAVKLHSPGYDHAKQLIAERKVVLDDRDDWSEHQPSAADENAFIDAHGYAEFGRWHLAIDDERPPDTKGRYKFPYGDFTRHPPLRDPRRRVAGGPAQVHRCRACRGPCARHARECERRAGADRRPWARPRTHPTTRAPSLANLVIASLSSAAAAVDRPRAVEARHGHRRRVTPILMSLFAEALRRPAERVRVRTGSGDGGQGDGRGPPLRARAGGGPWSSGSPRSGWAPPASPSPSWC